MNRRNKGILIVIEGLDGMGKTTAIRNAYNRLKALDIDVVKTAESAKEVEGLDNSFSSTLVNLVKESFTQQQADPTSQAMMINAARRAHYQNVLLPLLKAGKVILMDRFYLSTFYNYQSECQVNSQLYSLAMGGFKPDFTIVLQGNLDVAKDRIGKRLGQMDVTDQSALRRFATIQNKLLRFISNNPGVAIDGTLSMEEVADALTDEVLYAIEDIQKSRKQ